MRALVFLLVFANLLFYAFSKDYLGKPERPDGERLTRQVHPERLRIVARGEEPPPAPPAKPPEEAAAAESATAETAAAASAARVCLLWEHLPVIEADRLASLLGARFSDFTLKRMDGSDSGWWIYIPPLASKAEADKKTGELHQLGVADYFIVPDGPNRFAISLGVYSSEKGGRDRIAELKSKGVRSARLVARPGKDGTVALQAEGPAAEREALLGALNGGLSRMTARDCP